MYIKIAVVGAGSSYTPEIIEGLMQRKDTMKAFSQDMLSLENVCALHLQPDKRNLLSVLKGECPKRPTLFELFLNDRIHWDVTRDLQYDPNDPYARQKRIVDACCRLGYDCVSLYGARVRFPVCVASLNCARR